MQKIPRLGGHIHCYFNLSDFYREWILGPEVERVSFCELEVDVLACDILNKREIGGAFCLMRWRQFTVNLLNFVNSFRLEHKSLHTLLISMYFLDCCLLIMFCFYSSSNSSCH